jgi:hypothetical protein
VPGTEASALSSRSVDHAARIDTPRTCRSGSKTSKQRGRAKTHRGTVGTVGPANDSASVLRRTHRSLTAIAHIYACGWTSYRGHNFVTASPITTLSRGYVLRRRLASSELRAPAARRLVPADRQRPDYDSLVRPCDGVCSPPADLGLPEQGFAQFSYFVWSWTDDAGPFTRQGWVARAIRENPGPT